jgi:hypothetical protein
MKHAVFLAAVLITVVATLSFNLNGWLQMLLVTTLTIAGMFIANLFGADL